jgi:hypothetical protein
MKQILFAALLLVFAFGCNTAGDKTGNDSLPATADSSQKKTDTAHATLADSTKLIGTHLSDTAMFTGSWVIFLRPDSARFDFYSKKLKSGIGQTDEDFKDAIEMTGDSITGNKDFKGIKGMVSTKRYITFLDCKNGPVTIDRDTVNYGVILSETGRPIKAEQNVYGGPHYIKVIRKYFGR